VGRNTLLALLRTESEDAPYRHALARPHGVVLVELLRSPSGDGWIEFPRCIDVGRRELVPHELTVHGEVRSEGVGRSRKATCPVRQRAHFGFFAKPPAPHSLHCARVNASEYLRRASPCRLTVEAGSAGARDDDVKSLPGLCRRSH